MIRSAYFSMFEHNDPLRLRVASDHFFGQSSNERAPFGCLGLYHRPTLFS